MTKRTRLALLVLIGGTMLSSFFVVGCKNNAEDPATPVTEHGPGTRKLAAPGSGGGGAPAKPKEVPE